LHFTRADPKLTRSHPTLTVVTKAVEMVTESIPGTLLQIYAVVRAANTDDGVSYQVLAGVLVSALSVGFASASITFDIVRIEHPYYKPRLLYLANR
jgi:hypothetical protein